MREMSNGEYIQLATTYDDKMALYKEYKAASKLYTFNEMSASISDSDSSFDLNNITTTLYDWQINSQYNSFLYNNSRVSVLYDCERPLCCVLSVATIYDVCRTENVCPIEIKRLSRLLVPDPSTVTRKDEERLLEFLCNYKLFNFVVFNHSSGKKRLGIQLSDELMYGTVELNLANVVCPTIRPFETDITYINNILIEIQTFIYFITQHIDPLTLKRDNANNYAGSESWQFYMTFNGTRNPCIKGNALIIYNLMKYSEYQYIGQPVEIAMAMIQRWTGQHMQDVMDTVNYMCKTIPGLTARWVWQCEPEVVKDPTMLYLQFSTGDFPPYEMDNQGCCKIYYPSLYKNRVSGLGNTDWYDNGYNTLQRYNFCIPMEGPKPILDENLGETQLNIYLEDVNK